MRKVSILSLWLAALLMAVCFIGCSSGDSAEDSPATETSSADDSTSDSSGTPSQVVYKATESSFIYTAVFKNDGTFYINVAMNSYDMGHDCEGTYTGDASKDGTITVTILKKLQGNNLVDYTGADSTQEIVIANGQFTFDYNEYTRQ